MPVEITKERVTSVCDSEGCEYTATAQIIDGNLMAAKVAVAVAVMRHREDTARAASGSTLNAISEFRHKMLLPPQFGT